MSLATPAPAGTDPSQRAVAVTMRGVEKYYGKFRALSGIDLEVRRGEKIVICGPSGSGKSTLIRTINRLEPHDGGTIVVNGVELDGSAAKTQDVRLEVGMVFQQFNLFPHLTILENCMLAPRLGRGISRALAEKRALQYLDRVHIAEQAHKYPSQLSGGQQQRVAIARALCMEPPIMLFDEPTSALDPEMIKEVLQVMEDLAADGMTMICVTHEMGFARRVATRCVFMDKGEIVEIAPATEFFEQPKSERLKGFLAQILH
ncbi:amino acid ABC transporter ATP-binding protein [Oharaeibacter diazotrophicus]|uniref:Amino acid ABC transporter ATP-binding protein (PAAT family) n=1 Tax=Oharaeibacter diazotrophicus TaxID=1920512 RepID=A0A4R6RLK9_9HYPH|nr:amino acid ABC transporter ATP-binding protein [Oharaeibacter diazotrophicus]TDP87382.1 amino acid ABC transporter ATP-binding protein (PAAT family) [Oharaeibacter diazotrophicus]BBE70674.1 glutamine transport ATP-binding protein GlnQ [Pleomorphomonas sp. SM30]GLS77421.1 ABC transporter ATP-binding protein [Oharaeibacter diazotrophicus]